MQEKAKEPEIRFAGFTGAWEQRKFSELYKRSSEKNDGSMGVDRFITVATMQFKSDIRVTEDEYLKTYFTFKLGDIAFEGNRSKNFKYGRFVENDIGDGLVSHVFIVMRPITNYDLYFWKYAIHNENLMRKILQRSTKSSTMMHDLVVQDFLNEKFSVPSLKEQKAIGNFLRTIDSLLTLHQRKYEKLLNIKKSMLEKMFPKEGEVVPEIRFKGFTGAWEQRKLGNLGETYTGLSGKSKEDFGHGTAKFITYMNVYSNPVSDPEGTDLIEVDNRQNTVRKGDVLFTTSSETPEEVGMSSVVFESIENTYLNSFCFGYRPKIEFNNFYLAFLLRSGGFRKNIIFLAQGISRYNISKNAVMNIPIPIPAKEEQEAIGDFFKHLDALLTLHQRKLEMLKNVKQAFLEKMFV